VLSPYGLVSPTTVNRPDAVQIKEVVALLDVVWRLRVIVRLPRRPLWLGCRQRARPIAIKKRLKRVVGELMFFWRLNCVCAK